MRRLAPVLFIVATATACGRLGFDDHATDAATAPPLPQLACDLPVTTNGSVATMGAQVSLAVGADQVVAISSDMTNIARTWPFAISGTSLVPGAVGTQLATDCTGTLAIANVAGSTNVLSAWSNTSGGADLQQLSSSADAIGASTAAGSSPASQALAQSGIDGALALVTVQGNGEVDVVRVDATGAATGPSVVAITSDVGAGDVEIATAGPGYALTWTDPRPSPNQKVVELLAADFSVVAGPVIANTDAFDAENGQVAWAPTSNTYLAAWQHKNITGNDEVNIRVFDSKLTPIAASSLVISSDTAQPHIVGDGDGFWLTGENYDDGTLIVDRIGGDGSVTALEAIQASALAWSIGTRNGQPVVTWLEQDALWLDTPCM